METRLLQDKDTFPTPDVLQDALGKQRYAVLESLIGTITDEEYGLTFEWRYYNDGKSWLGKAVYKKKTIFWLSVWKGFFRIAFYFTEKARTGVMELDITESVKSAFSESEATGKLVPLLLGVDKKRQLKDVLEVVQYKKTLK